MKYCIAVLALLISSLCFAQDGITIPDTLTCKKGRLVIIEAKTKAANVIWIWDYAENADVITISDNGSKAIFNTDTEGKYTVYALCAVLVNNKPVILKSNPCIIIVGTPVPPTPPVPPGPPLDEFGKQVFDVYNSLGKPKARLLDLSNFYRDGSKFANDNTVTNSYMLEKALQDTANTLMKQDLLEIRKLSSTYMQSKLPAKAGPMTPELRKQWVDCFTYLESVMRRVAQ